MHKIAEAGVASHWLYKTSDADLNELHQKTHQWLQSLLELQTTSGTAVEFLEHLKVDLFPDEVYVFTPKGKIMALPRGATAVDFAYFVHTDIGNGCVACRIDRNLAPLSTVLQSGQSVEIVTAPRARPNPTWLSFVVTAKARTNIRHFLKSQQRSESIELGRRLLDKALVSAQTSLKGLDPRLVEQFLAETRRPSLDAIFEEIGLGNRVAALTARRLTGGQEGPGTTETTPLVIRGTEGIALSYAKCCHPIPGDVIVGHISAGRGVVVHRSNCNNMTEILDDPEKSTPLRWAEETRGEFGCELLVELENRKGVIAAVANAISALDVNIEKITMEERDAELSQVRLIVAVADRVALARVIRRLRTVKSVIRVTRVRH
jgi:(p)ppGpp synthase/HD superfamily hydrolase